MNLNNKWLGREQPSESAPDEGGGKLDKAWAFLKPQTSLKVPPGQKSIATSIPAIWRFNALVIVDC